MADEMPSVTPLPPLVGAPRAGGPTFPLAVLEYVSDPNGDPMHWHDYLEIATVVEGRGTFEFGQRSLPAVPGDVFVIDNGQPHVATAEAGSSLRLLLVLFRPELIATPGARELDQGYLAPFRLTDGASPRICGTSALAAELRPVLLELLAIWTGDDPARCYLADATLRKALALVHRECSAQSTAAAARAAADRRAQIRPVLALVDDHCGEGITLADAARLAHVSTSRVRHLFREVTGVGFKEYLTQVRMVEARRLLLATDLPVAAVAASVSYTNLHQFYRVFHRSSTMSPAEYRRYYTSVRPGPRLH